MPKATTWSYHPWCEGMTISNSLIGLHNSRALGRFIGVGYVKNLIYNSFSPFGSCGMPPVVWFKTPYMRAWGIQHGGRKATPHFFTHYLLNHLIFGTFQEDYAMDTICKLIEKYEPSPTRKSMSRLSINGFLFLLNSHHTNIRHPDHTGTVYQDMTQPLSHYFISSSHNT